MPALRLATIALDQVLASACAYVLVLLVARSASAHDFGLFIIGFGVVTVAAAIGRAGLGAVLGMDLPVLGPDSGNDLTRRSGAAAVLLGLVATAALLAIAVSARGEVGATLCVMAGLVPMVLLQDLARYDLVARGRPQFALAGELVWLMAPLTLLLSDLVRDHTTSPVIAVSTWAGGLVGSLGVLGLAGQLRRPRFVGLSLWLTSDIRRFHLGADAAMSGLAPVGNAIGAAGVAGAATTAAVRGSAAVFAPLATLNLAMTLGAVPEARRRAAKPALRLLLTLTGGLVTIAMVWGGLMLTLPDRVGTEILGDTWTYAAPLIPYVAAEYVGLAVWSGATAMLRLAGDTRRILVLRLVYAPATLVLPVVALWVSDDARWFAGVLALLGLGVGGVGLAMGIRAVRGTSLLRQDSPR